MSHRSPPACSLLALPSRVETCEHGVALTSQGRSVDYVYFVVTGAIKLGHVCQDGREVIVELASGGDLVGAHSALCGEACQESAVTLSRCRLARWEPKEFRARLATDADFAGEVLRVTIRQALALRRRLLEFAVMPAKQRLCGLFWFWLERVLKEAPAPSGGFTIPLARVEIAQLLSITPYHLSRVLNELERAGFILREDRYIRVLRSLFVQEAVQST